MQFVLYNNQKGLLRIICPQQLLRLLLKPDKKWNRNDNSWLEIADDVAATLSFYLESK